MASPWGAGPSAPTRQISSFRYRVARFRARVVQGIDRGASVDSVMPEITIGSAEGNHLRLSDPSVSRHHCVVTATPDGARIRDLGSTNGTAIAGCRVDSAYLAPGVTVRLGETEIVFERLEEDITEPVSREENFGPLIGTSVTMRRMFAVLPRVAAADATILVEGETGTGKSLLAEAIHGMSARADGPFVVVDCGSIPPTLIESELFGHEKGSFTGAHSTRVGFFESAAGGTVFLDEIGELPQDLQPKLLRVLENRVIRRVGSTSAIPIDVRVIAATNRDLRQEVNRGTFRSDLWYRLNTVKLSIPPLREHPEDIPLLVHHFYSQLAESATATPPPELVDRLCRSDWPGNVRELRSAVERALLFDDSDLWRSITSPQAAHHSEQDFDASLSFRAAKTRAMGAWERGYLQELIRRNDGNISKAARAARMDRNHLRELLIRHEINIPGR